MRRAKHQIVWVSVSMLRRAPGNPMRRTKRDGRAFKDLLRRIHRNGFDEFRPLLISREGIIGDGHRRYEVAVILDMQEVPVIFTDKTHLELFEGNTGAQAITGAQWIQAYVSRITRLDQMPHSVREQIALLEQVGGTDLLAWLAERNVSPGIWDAAYKAGRLAQDTTPGFLEKAVRYMVIHRAQRKALESDYTPPHFWRAAIENNLELQQVFWRDDMPEDDENVDEGEGEGDDEQKRP